MAGRAAGMPKDNLLLNKTMDPSGSQQATEEDQLLSSLLLQLLAVPPMPRLIAPEPTYDYSMLLLPLSLPSTGGETASPLEPFDAAAAAAAYIAPASENSSTTTESGFFFPTWEDRSRTAPPRNAIRLLEPARTGSPLIAHLWSRDYTLAEWIDLMAAPDQTHIVSLPDGSGSTVDVSCSQTQVLGVEYRASISDVFYRNQRRRWLARTAINRWRQRVWYKKPQCGVDLIEMEPVREADAIYLTDTTNRTVFKFHRRDIFNCLISNICSADEMLPNPRAPTNPWTNAPLTLAQTIAICQYFIADHARRGRCPPVMFAAFCAAGYNISRFLDENLSLLSQYAISAYFKDIHQHNLGAVTDTILQLLSAAGANYSPVAMRRWIRQTPVTPLHREWLALTRDYTLYINLRLQIRPTWYDEEYIYADVRRLYARTRPADPAGPRTRLLRSTAAATPSTTPPIPPSVMGANDTLASLSFLLAAQPPTLSSLLSYFDLSGNDGFIQ